MMGVTPAELQTLIAILAEVPRDNAHVLLDGIRRLTEAQAAAIREQLPRHPDLLRIKLFSDLRGLLIERGENPRGIAVVMETEIGRAAACSTKGEVRPTDAVHEVCRKLLPLLRNSNSPDRSPIGEHQIRNILRRQAEFGNHAACDFQAARRCRVKKLRTDS